MLEENVRYATITKASKATGLSAYYLRKGCRNGTVPHIMSGVKYMIDVPALLGEMDVGCSAVSIGCESESQGDSCEERITAVDYKKIPALNAYLSKVCDSAVIHFYETNEIAGEIDCMGKDAKVMRNKYERAVRRLGLPFKVMLRGQSVFLLRTDKGV